jgi:hypothetical protein
MQSANVSSSAAGPRTKFVGVVANGRYLTLAEAGRPFVFVPLEQNFRGAMTLVVRTKTEPLLIMVATGGGKTFMAMLFLLMMARAKPRNRRRFTVGGAEYRLGRFGFGQEVLRRQQGIRKTDRRAVSWQGADRGSGHEGARRGVVCTPLKIPALTQRLARNPRAILGF